MPTDIKGETTIKVKAGPSKGSTEGSLSYGATIGCHNATGVQWKDLHIKIKGLKPGNPAHAEVHALDAQGAPTTLLGYGDGAEHDGEATINIDPITVDANTDFSITIKHNPHEKETEYTVTVYGTDASGYPVT